MYKNTKETKEYLRELRTKLPMLPGDLELFVIPSFTSLEGARRELLESNITLGAQNMCWEEKGAYTGEISPLMLKETGVTLVEIGHSERRHILGETDEQENKKVLCAMRNQLKALLCIGETKQDKEEGKSDQVLACQLIKGLQGIEESQVTELWVAYEPVWAIGENGKPPELEYVKERHNEIRKVLCSLFGNKGNEVPILYGGSVNRGNAEDLIKIEEVNGLFIGRSAWNAAEFKVIIESVYKCWKTKNEKKQIL
ncbi:MAG: triosephosphate isomerase [Lachnospiraceae bacterium]|nr:triosephosphate isomerase [Lachnospiraceae bacterium]MBD5455595.1 triosephosphate isomerase [Lachnospiraceae bacterium]